MNIYMNKTINPSSGARLAKENPLFRTQYLRIHKAQPVSLVLRRSC
jgi:hypothetical protein